MDRLIGSAPASASFRTCMYSVENACLVIALGAALAFPPGFLLSALGVRTWCSIYGEAAAHTQCIRAASRGSVWAMPHFHCTLNTVRFVLYVHGVVHGHKSGSCVRAHLTRIVRGPCWLKGSMHVAWSRKGHAAMVCFFPPAHPSLGCKVRNRVLPLL